MSRSTAAVGEVTTPMRRGKTGQRALACGVKQAFGLQSLLQLQEGLVKKSHALWLD